MSRGIDFDRLEQGPEQPQKPEPRRHFIMAPDPEDIRGFVAGLKRQYPFYGVLLPNPKTPQVTDYLRTNWELLHKMSGSACLVVTTFPPAQLTDTMRQFLVSLFRNNADEVWQHYQSAPQKVAGDEFEAASSFGIDLTRLPCLVLMTDLDSNQKLIQRLPNWEADDLTQLFEEVFSKINQHQHEPDPAKRLGALKGELGMTLMAKLQARRAARGIQKSLSQIDWPEVIKSTLTNQELMTSAFKAVLGAFGLVGG